MAVLSNQFDPNQLDIFTGGRAAPPPPPKPEPAPEKTKGPQSNIMTAGGGTLPMLGTAREIMQTHEVLKGDIDRAMYNEMHDPMPNPPNNREALTMARKYDESVQSGLRDDLLKNGMYAPISVSDKPGWERGLGQIVGGHHRLAVALREPSMRNTLLTISHQGNGHSDIRDDVADAWSDEDGAMGNRPTFESYYPFLYSLKGDDD